MSGQLAGKVIAITGAASGIGLACVRGCLDAGARVVVTFNGTGITWMGYRDEWSGLAEVFVDGALQSTVDTYLTPSKTQTPTYSVTGLTAGAHTLSIVATGTHNEASGGSCRSRSCLADRAN